MGLGITGASGNVQGPFQNQNASTVQELRTALKDFLTKALVIDVNEADEAGAAVRTRKEVGQKTATESMSTQQTKEQEQPGLVTFKPKQDGTLNDPQKETQLAALVALLAQDDDQLDVRKKKRKSEFEIKLDKLKEMEGLIADLECNDPENQALLESFLQQMNTLKRRQSELRRLNETIEQHRETLKKQDEEDKRREEASQKAHENLESGQLSNQDQKNTQTEKPKRNFNKIAQNTGQIPFPVIPVNLEDLE